MEQPQKAQQNLDSSSFDWKENLLASFSPLKPHWLEDENLHENLHRHEQQYMKDVIDEVEFKDEMRDHSIEQLTPEEHKEIALFHSYK